MNKNKIIVISLTMLTILMAGLVTTLIIKFGGIANVFGHSGPHNLAGYSHEMIPYTSTDFDLISISARETWWDYTVLGIGCIFIAATGLAVISLATVFTPPLLVAAYIAVGVTSLTYSTVFTIEGIAKLAGLSDKFGGGINALIYGLEAEEYYPEDEFLYNNLWPRNLSLALFTTTKGSLDSTGVALGDSIYGKHLILTVGNTTMREVLCAIELQSRSQCNGDCWYSNSTQIIQEYIPSSLTNVSDVRWISWTYQPPPNVENIGPLANLSIVETGGNQTYLVTNENASILEDDFDGIKLTMGTYKGIMWNDTYGPYIRI